MPRRSQPEKKTAYDLSIEYKLRLPRDVAARIKSKAEAEGRPQNRIIINELAEYPGLKDVGELREQVGDLGALLLKYSARLTWQELSDELLSTVDALLKTTQGAAQQVALDKLSAVRNAMKKFKAGDSK
jgi:hypothetical protein